MPSDIPVSTDATQWPEPIAVLSLACSFPRASTPAEFIATMEKCEDIRTGPPNKRWGTRIRQDTGFKGTYLENIEYFDHGYFGLSENEAGELDAQQRIAVQVCHEALMNAGYYTAATPENEREGKRSAEDAACFVGVANGMPCEMETSI